MLECFGAAIERVRRGEMALSGLLSSEMIERLCAEAGYASSALVYTPVVVVMTWLQQVISNRRCCQKAVEGLIAHRVASDQSACSADTGGYCKARGRLPEAACWGLLRETGARVEAEAPQEWRWQGRRVRVVDGSTLSIADTEANRAAYPLMRGLKPGLSFPVVRMLVVFSLSVGTVLEAAIRPYQGKGTSETGMLRGLAERFAAGDVLLGDRCFSGYWDIAWWQQRGIDVVVRNSASRSSDFRRGQRLGKDDHLITWRRTERPEWLPRDEAAALPQTLLLREVKIRVTQRGFRTRVVVLITTLLDPLAYPRDALAELYRRRWQAELNLRSLKTHLDMQHLRCKTPEMVRKEFALFLSAYNLIRHAAALAAVSTRGRRLPWQISFQGARDGINEFFPRLPQASSRTRWTQALLTMIAQLEVAHRPDRLEPYATKTRPKDFPPPTQTRQQYRNQFRSKT